MKVQKKKIGTHHNKNIYEYTLVNSFGIKLSIMNYGATITKLITKDKHGNDKDIVLGFTDFKGYLQSENRYYGSTIGRYANRLSDSQFVINETVYKLNPNSKKNSLHGGINGFDKKIWDSNIDYFNNCISFFYKSVDMEEGYPGNLNVIVKFSLTNSNEVVIEYEAKTDKPTPVNITNHSYFNLSSKENTLINEHFLQIDSNYFLEVNSDLIPTGNFINVENTRMDFRTFKKIEDDFDHNWVLNNTSSEIKLAATLYCDDSDRCMEIYTTLPGLQFYSGNKIIDCKNFTKNLHGYTKNSGLCLETQFFPDSPNHLSFPNTILNPNDIYNHITVYKFINQ